MTQPPTAPDYAGALKELERLDCLSVKGGTIFPYQWFEPASVNTIRQALALAADLVSGDSVVVPREPTPDIMDAMNLHDGEDYWDNFKRYKAVTKMIAAPAERG